MRRRRSKIQLTESGKKLVLYVSLGTVISILLLFFALFRVDHVLIVGSTRYTDAEIRSYAMKNILTHNTMLTSWFYDHKDVENIPFLESFDYERVDNQTLRIHVNEKQIIGYIVQGMDKLYFDKEGVVVEQETMTEEDITKMENAQQELDELKAEAERLEALKKAQAAEAALTGNVTTPEDEPEDEAEPADPVQIDTAQVLIAEEVSEEEKGAQHKAAVTDVPRVIGIIDEKIQLGQTIPVEDEEIFYTILGITRMVEKYDILPEILWFDENMEITLVYFDGNVHCQLGKDILMEEKITRVATILPELEDKTGILHLEDYSEDTVNIIFSQESRYDIKMKMMEAYISEDTADSIEPTNVPNIDDTNDTNVHDDMPVAEPDNTQIPQDTVTPAVTPEIGNTGDEQVTPLTEDLQSP